MFQDFARKTTKADFDGAALLAGLKPQVIAIQPDFFVEPSALGRKIDDMQDCFDADWDRIAAISDVLLDEDSSSYGKQATDIFSQWEAEGAPCMPALVAYTVNYWGLDLDDGAKRALLIVATLAELPNDLQYHGNDHYRKVLCHTIRLIATHNHLFEGQGSEHALDADDIVQLLIAACIHDLGHQGGDNMRDGIYAPGFLEQRAADIARPYLEAAGFDRDMIGNIETMVFCTDITFFAGDNSPCIRMKKIYKHFFWDDQTQDVSLTMMGKLRRFEDNPALAQMAMMLHEADIATSAGLSYEQTKRETINIMEERGLRSAGPRMVLAFLREQLGEMMFTEAGKQVFGAEMSEIVDRAEMDILAGRDSFYN